MNIEKLQRFRHDSRGVHEDQGGDYLWYDDVVTLIEEDKKERERCVEVLKSAIGLKVEGKRVSHPMDSLKSRLAELEGIADRLYQAAKSGHVTSAVAMDLVDGLIAYEAYKEGKK